MENIWPWGNDVFVVFVLYFKTKNNNNKKISNANSIILNFAFISTNQSYGM